MAWSRTVRDMIRLPNPNDDPRVKAAWAFKGEVEAEPGAEYEWVYEYAREAYGRQMGVRDALDDKASEIIKYLGGGAGLFTLAALLNVQPQDRDVLTWALPSFVATLAALFFAILARRPNVTMFPPTVEGAKCYADHFKRENTAKAAFLGQWHLAYEGLRAINETMADCVQASIWFFFAAIVLLILPIAVTLFDY